MDVAELVADDRVDAVAVDTADDALLDEVPALRRAGLLVLLTGPLVRDPARLRAIRQVADAPDLAVALSRRWEPWARLVTAALPMAGEVRQVTVRGWPRGERETAELTDLLTAWCGELVAACAGDAVPVPVLPDGATVSWSVLTATGATVLVSHDGAPQGSPLVRLSSATARLDAGPDRVRWDGGAELPLPAGGLGRVNGLMLTAAALRAAVGGLEVPTDDWPWPADLGDLTTVGRVLTALEESARTGAPVRLA